MQEFIGKLKASGGTAHVMGLMSPGGVHSHQHQIAALARIVADAGVPVAVHAFLDGRDTPPKSAIGYLKQFQSDVSAQAAITITTVAGRYYAMDRDKRWDRVERAYRTLSAAQGERADDPVKAVEAAYARGETDEFVLPTVIGGDTGMRDGDGVFFANFRADRVRETAAVLLDPGFSAFDRGKPVGFAAATKAVETVDACLGRLSQAVEKAGGTLVITADHGNAEMMRDPKTGEPHTAHTLNPVPFVVVNPPVAVRVEGGRLADVAPTLLDLLGLPKPAAMTGHSLLVTDQRRRAAG